MLAAEVADLVAMGADVGVAGFGAGEINNLLELHQQGGTPAFPDEAPEPPANPASRPGDLWHLGPHRLLCGDATEVEDLRRVLDGGLADMTFTDPPYNVGYEGKTARRMTIANDALGDGFAALLESACRNILACTKGAAYVCMSSSELGTLKRAFEAAGGHWSTFIVWSKNAFTLGRSDNHRQYEPILYGWAKGSDHYWCGARDQGDVWNYDRPVKNDLHPTMKPVALVERAIRNSSKSRDTVLDPFAGSGSTLMAAEASGRTAALLEIDPAFCDVIVRRWQEATGGIAVLDGKQRTSFAAVAAHRRATGAAEAAAGSIGEEPPVAPPAPSTAPLPPMPG